MILILIHQSVRSWSKQLGDFPAEASPGPEGNKLISSLFIFFIYKLPAWNFSQKNDSVWFCRPLVESTTKRTDKSRQLIKSSKWVEKLCNERQENWWGVYSSGTRMCWGARRFGIRWMRSGIWSKEKARMTWWCKFGKFTQSAERLYLLLLCFSMPTGHRDTWPRVYRNSKIDPPNHQRRVPNDGLWLYRPLSVHKIWQPRWQLVWLRAQEQCGAEGMQHGVWRGEEGTGPRHLGREYSVFL